MVSGVYGVLHGNGTVKIYLFSRKILLYNRVLKIKGNKIEIALYKVGDDFYRPLQFNWKLQLDY